MSISNYKTILITGASGFLGQHLVPFLKKNWIVTTASIKQNQNFQEVLRDIDTIVCMTGIAHQENVDPELYFNINADLPVQFAKAAKEMGVKHFIYISSVKVYSESSDKILNELSECHPSGPYGESKLLAEKELTELADADFIVSHIRPAVVYGAGVKGNIRKIMNWVDRLPVLPFQGIDSVRSIVFVGNFIAFVKTVIDQQAPGVFVAADEPKSTTEIVKEILSAKGLNKALINFPGILKWGLRNFKRDVYQRLFESFVVDSSATNKQLNFSAPYSFSEGIRIMVKGESEIKTGN